MAAVDGPRLQRGAGRVGRKAGKFLRLQRDGAPRRGQVAAGIDHQAGLVRVQAQPAPGNGVQQLRRRFLSPMQAEGVVVPVGQGQLGVPRLLRAHDRTELRHIKGRLTARRHAHGQVPLAVEINGAGVDADELIVGRA